MNKDSDKTKEQLLAELDNLRKESKEREEDLKATNRQLENENKRFLAAMEAIDAGVYVSDMQTHELIFLNKYLTDSFGKKTGEKCYKALQNLDSPCDFCTNHLLLDQNNNPKKPYVWEHKNRITNRWYQVRDQAIRWTDGRLVRLEIATDITERKKHEQQIKEERDLFSQGPAVVFKWKNAKGWPVEYVSNNVIEMLGYTPEQLKSGKIPYIDLIYPEDLDRVASEVEQHSDATTERFIHEPYRLVSSDGEARWVKDNTKIIRENGEITHYLGYLVDITDRKQAEEALQQSEANLNNFFNLNIDFLWVLDEYGNIIAINNTVKRRLGYKEEELVGESVLMVHPPHQREKAGEIVQGMLKGELDSCPIPIMTKDGSKIPVETYISRGKWNGKPALFGVSKDISELKLSEEKFAKAFHTSPSIVGLSDLDLNFVQSRRVLTFSFKVERFQLRKNAQNSTFPNKLYCN